MPSLFGMNNDADKEFNAASQRRFARWSLLLLYLRADLIPFGPRRGSALDTAATCQSQCLHVACPFCSYLHSRSNFMCLYIHLKENSQGPDG